jgi:hypothetical protein
MDLIKWMHSGWNDSKRVTHMEESGEHFLTAIAFH